MRVQSQIVESEGTDLLGSGSVNTFPRKPNHVTAATDTHATIEELLDAVFCAIIAEAI
jgi:hypothetical protein